MSCTGDRVSCSACRRGDSTRLVHWCLPVSLLCLKWLFSVHSVLCFFGCQFAGVAVRVAVQANAVQQCLTPLERSTIRACQILVSLLDPHNECAQFTGDVCNRHSVDLGEPHRLALTLLHRGPLNFCIIRVSLVRLYHSHSLLHETGTTPLPPPC